MSTYKCRELAAGASWGIAIDLSAIREPMPPLRERQVTIGKLDTGCYRVTDDVWLTVTPDCRLTQAQASCLRDGLSHVAGRIKAAKGETGPVLIKVCGLKYNPTDYQHEGLVLAMARWAAKEFGFEPPAYSVLYKKSVKRYIIKYEG